MTTEALLTTALNGARLNFELCGKVLPVLMFIDTDGQLATLPADNETKKTLQTLVDAAVARVGLCAFVAEAWVSTIDKAKMPATAAAAERGEEILPARFALNRQEKVVVQVFTKTARLVRWADVKRTNGKATLGEWVDPIKTKTPD